ncbi:hypothetical protein A8950_2478 [Dongia mobilis]|uniref:DUF1513 domain-containing protein n=2 Tax=Dongia mobilis TaxID=578943 RepID=A0A4R6WQ80_9PROT|nr:hypothetical protein A8950_2478 [Dongia mobilis]
MAPELSTPAYLACCGVGGGFAAIGLDGDGRPLWHQTQPARAHDIIGHADLGICAVVARKPGTYVAVCDLVTGKTQVTCKAVSGHHFDGHGVFSLDGREIFATQSADRTQDGLIAVYDTRSGALLRTFPSQGTEPHELIWSEPGILAIAHGGIVNRNDPDAIDSSLVLLEAESGEVLRRWVLDDDWETLSIRHLAGLTDGGIVFAMQDQDAATDRRPLVGIATASGALSFLPIPPELQPRLDGYIGSVAADTAGRVVAATAPRGGVAMFWSVDDGRFIGRVDLPDVCGVAPGAKPGTMRLTSGHGRQLLAAVDSRNGISGLELAEMTEAGIQWDNHLARVAPGAGGLG